jgi:hypothetical protein
MDNSPLKKLPLELRLEIYEMVFYAEDGVKVTLNKPVHEKKHLPLENYASRPHFLALRSTCKEIAQETNDVVFKVNDFWTFVQPNDDSTTWGKRLRQWCLHAGEECLQRAQDIEFDIGQWDSRPQWYPRGDITILLHAQIGSMYQNLPKQLRQCKQSFKLRIRWSSGVKLADGSRDRLNVVTLILPLWTDDLCIQEWVFEAASQARKGLYKYDDIWHMGSKDGKIRPNCEPPRYDKQLEQRIIPERTTLNMLAHEIGFATCIALSAKGREMLEKCAIDFRSLMELSFHAG